MRTLYPHASSKAHLDAVKEFDNQRAMDHAYRQRFEEPRPRSPTPPLDHVNRHFDHPGDNPEPPSPPPSPLTLLRRLDLEQDDPFDLGFGAGGSDSDGSDDGMSFDRLRVALDGLANELDDEEADDRLDNERLEEEIAEVHVEDAAEWYPFKKVEHVVALLMIGSTRNLLSRTQYQHIRSILRVLDINLPEWGTLRALVKQMKKNLGLNIQERTSPCGNPLFGLDIKNVIVNVSSIYI
ncbi:uncharacterized protein MELLADRAFT_92350 [Melampsora larici-populina 98AG31]|uniref:Uncharacterized protein n=1 Tax=Melampsora larici-populina (strain 98AG31 / pathotype 3-4-7) TaxID=747676 RepID=F4R9A9_MELLP|nr:uncharacterized protein MELLADRAFT_92350 [Melampsora larici-populina 98AG31]EGG11187.1 hypothetical protein MELLADRAFT_92350 [Melampsora larici-populina 98AG31]